MLARAELAKARGVLGWAAVDSGREPGPAAESEDEAAFRELTTTLTRPDQDAARAEGRAELLARRRVLWDRIMTARGRAGRELAIPEFSLAALQSVLGPDEAIISYYWLTRTALTMVTIDRTSLAAEQVNLDAGQRATLSGLAAAIGGIGRSAPWLKREIPALGALLLPTQGGELLAGKRRVIISPHRLLHQLPFHAFDYGHAPLAEQFAVSYVPNLTSLLLPAPGPQAPDVLALGVSAFADPRLQPLANAGPEAAAIARLYQHAGVPVTELIDQQATAARLTELREQGALARYSLLHLVTHGDDLPPEAPFEAGLRLSAGEIDGLEISQWQLHAELVVLSACYSARRAIRGRAASPGAPGRAEPAPEDEELFGDEVLGLQAAFFAAGAQQVAGALWPADDRAAPQLMAAFHREMIGGQPADLALRAAMLELRAAGASLYQWAPYKLVRLAGRARPASRPADSTVIRQEPR
jgi:hypothetical protein